MWEMWIESVSLFYYKTIMKFNDWNIQPGGKLEKNQMKFMLCILIVVTLSSCLLPLAYGFLTQAIVQVSGSIELLSQYMMSIDILLANS